MGTIWWMNRLESCKSESELECVMAWYEASLAYTLAQWNRAFRELRALSP